MNDFRLDEESKRVFYSKLKNLLAVYHTLTITVRPTRTSKRTLSQNALCHKWYKQISDHLIKLGRGWCNEAWVKQNLKATYLGFDEVEYTDFITGEKYVRHELKQTSKLSRKETAKYMRKIEGWAGQFYIKLAIPAGCEYEKTKKELDM